jgi:hypothetical protein
MFTTPDQIRTGEEKGPGPRDRRFIEARAVTVPDQKEETYVRGDQNRR